MVLLFDVFVFSVRLRACKEITCSMDFKKQRPDSPFFFEQEQVISLRRLTCFAFSTIKSLQMRPNLSRFVTRSTHLQGRLMIFISIVIADHIPSHASISRRNWPHCSTRG